MPKDFDYVVLDNDKTFETSPGNPIQLDTPKWFSWLADGENNSFRFNADDNSYRARKEYNKVQDTHYWYAVKKVNGRLHKKFIGKSEQVTHDRLCEVAKTITVPPKSKPHTTDIDNQSTHTTHTINTPTLQELVNQVQELANRLDNLESRGEDATVKKPEYLPNEELEARIRELERLNTELTKQLTNEQVKVSSLSKNLQRREDNFPYSLEYIKQFGDFYMDALRHKEKLPSSEVDRHKIEVRKFINFIEANKKVPSPSGGFSHGMDFDLRRGEDIVSLSSCLNELTSELTNKDGQLQELTNNIANLNSKLNELTNELANKDRELQELKAAVPSPQSPITNTQPVEAEGRSQEAGENLTAGGDGEDMDSDCAKRSAEGNRQTADPSPDFLDKPTIMLHDGSILVVSEKQEKILILLGLIPQTHNILTSQFLSVICKDNLTTNKGELESLIGGKIDSKGSTIRKTAAILRGAGFTLSGGESKGFKITGVKQAL